MKVGEEQRMKGFFTKALYLRGRTATEVERRLGYRAGRLAEGWWLCFLLEMPVAAEFEVRGYSQMSGGVAQGHLPTPPDPRNAEQRLKGGGHDLSRIKAGLIADTFKLRGPDRLAKVIPARAAFGDMDYPPGSGIPQWTLIREKRFRVAAFVEPGKTYQGNYV